MSLPSNFDDWEHFQSTLMQLHNRRVKRAFPDLGGDNWTPNINTPRAGLRQACTIKDSDNALICLSKQLFFWFELGFIETLIEPYYGIPVAELQSNIKFKPQLTFYFKEDLADAFDNEQRPIRARISKRLVNETSATVTKTKLINLANKIKAELCNGGGYKFKRGKELYTYKDEYEGYNFQLYTWDKATAKEIINKIMDIFSDTPDWKKLFHHLPEEPAAAFPITEGNINILGETEKIPLKRRVGHVRFQRCDCRIWGRTKPVTLIDRTGKTFDPLVFV